jgi:hypothetical protein
MGERMEIAAAHLTRIVVTYLPPKRRGLKLANLSEQKFGRPLSQPKRRLGQRSGLRPYLSLSQVSTIGTAVPAILIKPSVPLVSAQRLRAPTSPQDRL